jgi:hypothetical protein
MLLYLCGLPFKALLREEMNHGYPHAGILGEQGGGKTTVMKMLVYPFLNIKSATNIENSTKVAMQRRMTRTNGPVVFNEYTNNGNFDLLDRFNMLLKSAYDGDSIDKADLKDGVIIEQVVNASVLFTGETTINNGAVKERTLAVNLSKDMSKVHYITHNVDTNKKYIYHKHLKDLHTLIIKKLYMAFDLGKFDIENEY